MTTTVPLKSKLPVASGFACYANCVSPYKNLVVRDVIRISQEGGNLPLSSTELLFSPHLLELTSVTLHANITYSVLVSEFPAFWLVHCTQVVSEHQMMLFFLIIRKFDRCHSRAFLACFCPRICQNNSAMIIEVGNLIKQLFHSRLTDMRWL